VTVTTTNPSIRYGAAERLNHCPVRYDIRFLETTFSTEGFDYETMGFLPPASGAGELFIARAGDKEGALERSRRTSRRAMATPLVGMLLLSSPSGRLAESPTSSSLLRMRHVPGSESSISGGYTGASSSGPGDSPRLSSALLSRVRVLRVWRDSQLYSARCCGLSSTWLWEGMLNKKQPLRANTATDGELERRDRQVEGSG
jgi:hypothetical protein